MGRGRPAAPARAFRRYFDFELPDEVDEPLLPEPLLLPVPIDVVLPDWPVWLPVALWPCALAPVPLPVLLLPLPAWRVSLLPVPEALLPPYDDEPYDEPLWLLPWLPLWLPWPPCPLRRPSRHCENSSENFLKRSPRQER